MTCVLTSIVFEVINRLSFLNRMQQRLTPAYTLSTKEYRLNAELDLMMRMRFTCGYPQIILGILLVLVVYFDIYTQLSGNWSSVGVILFAKHFAGEAVTDFLDMLCWRAARRYNGHHQQLCLFGTLQLLQNPGSQHLFGCYANKNSFFLAPGK